MMPSPLADSTSLSLFSYRALRQFVLKSSNSIFGRFFPILEPGHELLNGQRVLSVELALPSHNLHLGYALKFDGAQRTYSGFPLAYSWSRGANSHR
jgi:hypothetical protein